MMLVVDKRTLLKFIKDAWEAQCAYHEEFTPSKPARVEAFNQRIEKLGIIVGIDGQPRTALDHSEWLASTAYQDFLDEERASAQTVPY